MTFPGGQLDPSSFPLLSSGRTGIRGAQLHAPELPKLLTQASLEALRQFAGEMQTIIDSAGADEPAGLIELARLLEKQAIAEIVRRAER